MKGDLECCPKLETSDVKYVSGLSTILVATIQEAKDRISQIEYIFCNQLYPNFQTKSKSLHKIYADAEEEWKEKEKHLLEQIEKLRVEKQQVVEENKLLKVDKEKLNEKANVLLAAMLREQESKIDELQQEVVNKSKEVDEGMELQNKLLQLVQTKATMIVDKGRELKRNEAKSNELLAKMKSLEKNVEELQEEIRMKTEKVAEKTELANSLSEKLLSLLSLGDDNEKLKTENERLMHKVECLEQNLGGLKNKLREKKEETEGGRVLHAKLLQQIDMNSVEILKQKEQLEKSENDKKVLLEKVNGLEKVNELQENLSSSGKEAEGKVSYENLLRRIQLKDSELLAEKRKMRDLHGLCMKLRSQYNYLCTKSGLTMKNMLKDKLEDESGSFKHQPTTSSYLGNKSIDASAASCEMKEVKTENEFSDGLVDNKVVKSIPITDAKSPTSIYVAPKCPPTVKSAQITGTKRPASNWIDTRSRQGKDGPDPHDDFLDTPLEKLRADLDKAMEEEAQDLHIVAQNDKNMDPSSSDDEMQNINVDRSLGEQQMPVPKGGKIDFKYVESVRKKAERQNLKGVECKQCKKFYDAVLPNDGGDGNKQNIRCEHHEGVSRHRYKYVPPMTPEGFWNIGFESEM